MKNMSGGIRYIVRTYHDVMMVVLKEKNQTQKEAAVELGISESTFRRVLRLQGLPNFRTERGKLLAQRFERWSTVSIELLFPEAFFTKEFLGVSKTFERTMPFQLLMHKGSRKRTLALDLSQPLPAQSRVNGHRKPRKKNRKSRR